MKIVIIGAGISGCAAYLQLKKHLPQPRGPAPAAQHEITIYEAYDTSINTTHEGRHGDTHSSTLVVGGGLGIFPNGLNVLKRLDGDILRDIARGGYAIAHQDLRTKNGSLLMRMDTTADADPELDGKQMHLLGVSRHWLWRSLRLRIPDGDIETRRVARVAANESGRNRVYFADGNEPVEADLVIGADGIKGVTKLGLFPGQERDYAPEYQGLVGVGGFISTEEVKGLVEKGSMNLLFSGSGFFGYFYSSSAAYAPDRDSAYSVSEPGESLGWWSTYSADECPDPKTLDMEAVASQLRERHGDWKDPVIRKIIGSLNVKSMYPTWTSPQLPTWERDGVVLVGDAAHALPSTSGQGSSQALEDTEAFAMLLGHALHVVDQESSADTAAYKKAITTAAKQYIEIRRPRVQSILESAQRMQSTKRDMSWIAEYAMYCVIWIAGKSLITTIEAPLTSIGCFPKMMSGPTKRVINYNISEEVKTFIERG